MAVKKSLEQFKVAKAMHELKHGELHSGSKTGPLVTNPKQAQAIGFSEARAMSGKTSKNAFQKAMK